MFMQVFFQSVHRKHTDTLMRKYSWDGTSEPSAWSEKGKENIMMQYEDRVYSQFMLLTDWLIIISLFSITFSIILRILHLIL